MKAYPEIIFFDGTYKLFDNRLILTLFLVENSNRSTEVVAIAVIVNEDQVTYDWVFNRFRHHYEDIILKTKYFMSDKISEQREAFKKYCPWVQLLLCRYHYLETMKKEINSLNITKEWKQKILECVQ